MDITAPTRLHERVTCCSRDHYSRPERKNIANPALFKQLFVLPFKAARFSHISISERRAMPTSGRKTSVPAGLFGSLTTVQTCPAWLYKTSFRICQGSRRFAAYNQAEKNRPVESILLELERNKVKVSNCLTIQALSMVNWKESG